MEGVARPGATRLARYFLGLGTWGFGGPVALAGRMERDLVEHRRWLTPEEYKDGLALAQLSPGPLAAQLAMYFGWLHGGAAGAALTGVAFVLPSFLMVLGLSVIYLRYGGIVGLQAAFYGIGAAVIALMARSVQKLAKLTLARDPPLWLCFVAAAAVTAITETENVWVFLGAGALVAAWRGFGARSGALAAVPAWLVSGLHGPVALGRLPELLLFFAKAGAFVFGSGLAIVPFLRGGAVLEHHWLDDRQFLDAVAVAMVTPGPVVITVAFVGYLVAGPFGAVVAAAGTFLPCYFFTVVPAPYFQQYKRSAHLKAFVAGVTAAATGAIAGAAIVLGRRAIVDVPSALLAAMTLLVLTKTKKVPEPVVIVTAGLVGLAWKTLR